MSSTRVVVIGGGVVGVTTAAILARRGLNVTLLEGSPRLASGATARNGAQLSYSYSDPIGSPSILRSLPRLLTGLDPAFRIHATASSAFLSWALQLLANCAGPRFIANLRAVLRLALRSKAALAELRANYPSLNFDYSAPGKVHIYDSWKSFEAAKSFVQLKNELGCNQRAVDVGELLALEPALSKCPRKIVGAVYSPIDEAGDPSLFTRELAALAQRHHALTVLTNTHVDGFVVHAGQVQAVRTRHGPIDADRFVLTAGYEAPALAATVGVKLPIYPMKGYSITLPATASSPSVSVTDARAKIVFCRLRDQVRVAGTAELGRADDSVDRRRIRTLLQMAQACLPAAADWNADSNAWSGVRPMTPDSRPIIGGTPLSNLFLNCGHGMLGWTLACGSAELAASLILDERPTNHSDAMAEDFSLRRFSRRRCSATSQNQ